METKNIKQNRYYKRLNKLTLWPIVSFAALIFVVVTSQVLVLYLVYVPKILAPIERTASPEQVIYIASRINNIIFDLSGWIAALIAIDVLLIYVIWNVKKLFRDLEL